MQRLEWLDRKCSEHRLWAGLILGALLTGLLFLYNVHGGPLYNLNDIGTWQNRLLFTLYSSIVQMTLLAVCTALCRARFSRLALRQLILAAGNIIFLFAINQKTMAYNGQIQPIVRAMDTNGLQHLEQYATNLSAPALSVLCLISRGPIYDMYLVKLFAIACCQMLGLLICDEAAREDEGHYEIMLLLVSILPQGFMSSACAAQTDVFAALLAAAGLIALRRGRQRLGVCTLGIGAAMSGAVLLLLPLVVFMNRKVPLRAWGWAAAIPLALTLPAILFGMPAGEAVLSLVRSSTALPQAAAGTGTVFGFFPRALVEEMPQYWLLRPLPIDTVTLAAENYTQSHFVLLMHGLSFAALALGMGLYALEFSRKHGEFQRILCCTAIVLIVTPALSQGGWLPLCMLCIAGLFRLPRYRLPLCMMLFATAGGCAYPVTNELLLPPALISALCLAALVLLMDAAGERRSA